MARDVVGEIRDRADIVEIVGESVALKRAGRNYKGLCPFHTEKTPSFVVFPDSESFHCFGCGKGGDAFTFLMLRENLEFREALAELAERTGVPLEPVAAPERKDDSRRQQLLELNRIAAAFYANILLNSRGGEPGRELVSQRGVAQEMVRAFQLGFAPDGWDTLTGFLSSRGADLRLAVEAGLLQSRDTGGFYDRFRNRLLFPIRDRDGAIIGFGGRSLGDTQPKYLNSPQTDLFDKGRILYGLDQAKDAIRHQDRVIIVEGYMDVIAAHQFGFTNVVAAMGTAITEAQVDLVKRFTKRLVLALDADAAGEAAAVRSIESLHQSLETEGNILPDPQSMFRFGRKLDTEIRIALLPQETDPDEFIRRYPERWPELIESGTPYIEFLIEQLARSAPADDAPAKRRIVDRMAPVIQLVPDSIDRTHYVQLLSRRLDLDFRVVQARVQMVGNRRAGATSRQGPTPQSDAERIRPEDHLVALLTRYFAVCQDELDLLAPSSLLDARNREIVQRLQAQAGDATGAEPEALLESLPEHVAAHGERLLATLRNRHTQLPGEVREEIRQTIARLDRERHDQLADHLTLEIGQAERAGDSESLQALVHQLQTLTDLHRRLYPRRSPYFRDSRDTDALPKPSTSGRR